MRYWCRNQTPGTFECICNRWSDAPPLTHSGIETQGTPLFLRIKPADIALHSEVLDCCNHCWLVRSISFRALVDIPVVVLACTMTYGEHIGLYWCTRRRNTTEYLLDPSSSTQLSHNILSSWMPRYIVGGYIIGVNRYSKTRGRRVLVLQIQETRTPFTVRVRVIEDSNRTRYSHIRTWVLTLCWYFGFVSRQLNPCHASDGLERWTPYISRSMQVSSVRPEEFSWPRASCVCTQQFCPTSRTASGTLLTFLQPFCDRYIWVIWSQFVVMS